VSTRYQLHVPADILAAMLEHSRAELPNECCGLLAGRVADGVGVVTKRLPLVNSAASPTEYWSEPRSMLQAEKTMRAEQLDLLAVYHSHPTSPPIPSRTDLARNFYGESVQHLIISLEKPQGEVRAWRLREDGYDEVILNVVDADESRMSRNRELATEMENGKDNRGIENGEPRTEN